MKVAIFILLSIVLCARGDDNLTNTWDNVLSGGRILYDSISGQICSDNDTRVITNTIVSAGTFYQFQGLTICNTNGVLATSSNFTLSTAGRYRVAIFYAFSGTANSTAECHFFTNNAKAPSIGFNRKIGTGGDVGSASAGGIIQLPVGCIADFRVTASGNGDIYYGQHINFSIQYVGK